MMRQVNIKSLQKSLKNLPEPKEVDQRWHFIPPDRIMVLHGESAPEKPIEGNVLTLVATKYCEGSHCWLEWELEL